MMKRKTIIYTIVLIFILIFSSCSNEEPMEMLNHGIADVKEVDTFQVPSDIRLNIEETVKNNKKDVHRIYIYSTKMTGKNKDGLKMLYAVLCQIDYEYQMDAYIEESELRMNFTTDESTAPETPYKIFEITVPDNVFANIIGSYKSDEHWGQICQMLGKWSNP